MFKWFWTTVSLGAPDLFYFFENDDCGVTSPVWDAPARKHFCHKLSAVLIL